MKYFFTIIIAIFFCFPAINGFAQLKIKSPDLKIGIGYPYVFGNISGDYLL